MQLQSLSSICVEINYHRMSVCDEYYQQIMQKVLYFVKLFAISTSAKLLQLQVQNYKLQSNLQHGTSSILHFLTSCKIQSLELSHESNSLTDCPANQKKVFIHLTLMCSVLICAFGCCMLPPFSAANQHFLFERGFPFAQ